MSGKFKTTQSTSFGARSAACSTPGVLPQDKFERTTKVDTQSPIEKTKNSQRHCDAIKDKYNELQKAKLLPEEVISILEPAKTKSGELLYSASQLKIIESAHKRMKYFEDIAEELSQKAIDASPEVLKQVKDLFGGDESLGKYVIVREKSKTSVFNKLVKEFKEKAFYGDFMDRYAKMAFKKPFALLKESEKEILFEKHIKPNNPKKKELEKDDYDAINKPYANLSDDEKKILLMAIEDKSIIFLPKDMDDLERMYRPSKNEREKNIGNIKDLVGTRLILPSGSISEMEQVEKYISKAIRNNKIKITRLSNYHANHILPYINYKTAQKWKDAMPGMILLENRNVRKRNGYTTTQFNIVHPIKNKEASKTKDLSSSKISKKAQTIEKNRLKDKTVLGELQIRTQRLNDIGQIEHLIYDILEDKDISGGIPELQKYYDSIGIESAVHEVFNDAEKENSYIQYEKAMYSWTRQNEISKNNVSKYKKPNLEIFGLKDYKILSFESLAQIDKKAISIKKKYNNSQQKEKN